MNEIYYIMLKGKKNWHIYIQIFGLNEAIDQLALANSVLWHWHMLRMEHGHVLKMALVKS